MTILVLVRNFVPAHEQIKAGDWEVAAVAKGEYDLEGKVVGTLGAGRIGFRVLQRLKPFDCKELLCASRSPSSTSPSSSRSSPSSASSYPLGLHAQLLRSQAADSTPSLCADYDYNSLPEDAAKEVGVRRVEDLKDFLSQCDVVTLNCPLHEGTMGIINKETISYMKDGASFSSSCRRSRGCSARLGCTLLEDML